MGPPPLLLVRVAHRLPGLTCQRSSPLFARLSPHTELLLVSNVPTADASEDELKVNVLILCIGFLEAEGCQQSLKKLQESPAAFLANVKFFDRGEGKK